MAAGARAGALDEQACAALERYGLHLGVAFQAVDDLLDLSGDPAATGKSLLSDLREGKMTYPLILALERDPSLLPVVEACVGCAGESPPPAAVERVRATLARTGALDDCRAFARQRVDEAIACLAGVRERPGVSALITVAEATVHREH
jgi:octaprenyl-diphosphate synthase